LIIYKSLLFFQIYIPGTTLNKSKKNDFKEVNIMSALHSERKKGGGAMAQAVP